MPDTKDFTASDEVQENTSVPADEPEQASQPKAKIRMPQNDVSRVLLGIEIAFWIAAVVVFIIGTFMLRPASYIGMEVPAELAARDGMLAVAFILAIFAAGVHCLKDKADEVKTGSYLAMGVLAFVFALGASAMIVEKTAYEKDASLGPLVEESVTFLGLAPDNGVGVGHAFQGTRKLLFENARGESFFVYISQRDAVANGPLSTLGLVEGSTYNLAHYANTKTLAAIEPTGPDMVDIATVKTV